MRIHAYDPAALPRTDLVFRQSRLWMVLAAGVSVILGSVGIGIFYVHGPVYFGCAFIGVGALFTVLLVRRAMACLAAENWLLRCDARRMAIKIGRLFGRGSANTWVAELERGEIAWVRAYWLTIIMDQAGERTSRPDAYLEIKLRDGIDLEPLRSCLATARKPATWHGWSSVPDIPVSVSAEGLIRLQWRGVKSIITPGLKSTIRLLAEQYQVQPEVAECNDFTVSTADKQKMERLIVELVEQGRMIDAVKLARQRYGYSLTQAREFVENLRGGGA